MLPLRFDELISILYSLFFYFVIGSLGAFLKDWYETLTNKNETIRLGEILIGGLCSTFICYGFQDFILQKFSVNFLVFINFLLGILGFEIFGNITNLQKLKTFLFDLIEIRNNLRSGSTRSSSNESPTLQDNSKNESNTTNPSG